MKYFKRNKRYKYELAENVTYPVPLAETTGTLFVRLIPGHISIKDQYSWDGSSIPFKKFLGKITFGKYDGDRYCKEASLVHDAFYQLMRLNLLSRDHKDAIDRLYEKMCIEGATKIIYDEWHSSRNKILALDLPEKKLNRRLRSLIRKNKRQIKRLPAWAARRYWAVKTFGARTLKPRYRPEKVILET